MNKNIYFHPNWSKCAKSSLISKMQMYPVTNCLLLAFLPFTCHFQEFSVYGWTFVWEIRVLLQYVKIKTCPALRWRRMEDDKLKSLTQRRTSGHPIIKTPTQTWNDLVFFFCFVSLGFKDSTTLFLSDTVINQHLIERLSEWVCRV